MLQGTNPAGRRPSPFNWLAITVTRHQPLLPSIEMNNLFDLQNTGRHLHPLYDVDPNYPVLELVEDEAPL